MTVYLDIVLIENLCMNYIILFATGFILKTKLHHVRMIFSALVGAIYAILAYMQIFEVYSNMLVKIVLSICMVYIAFFPKNMKAQIKYLVMFYLVSFVFGGCAFALLYFVKPEEIFMVNGVYVGTYPIKTSLLGVVVGFVTMYVAFRVIKNRIGKKNIIYDIEICVNEQANLDNIIDKSYGGNSAWRFETMEESQNSMEKKVKTVRIKAMLDTGNQLKEPITGTPVIIAEKESLKGLLPDNILDNVEEYLTYGKCNKSDMAVCYKERFRVVPFQSIGKQNGMLLGFRVDEVKVFTDIDAIINKDVIVCLYNKNLTKTNAYSALIGLDMLEGRKKYEFTTNIKV